MSSSTPGCPIECRSTNLVPAVSYYHVFQRRCKALGAGAEQVFIHPAEVKPCVATPRFGSVDCAVLHCARSAARRLTCRRQKHSPSPPFCFETLQAGRRRARRRGRVEARRDRMDAVQRAGKDEEVVQRERGQCACGQSAGCHHSNSGAKGGVSRASDIAAVEQHGRRSGRGGGQEGGRARRQLQASTSTGVKLTRVIS